MEFIDIPKEEILAGIEPELKHKIEIASKMAKEPIIVDRLEWINSGIRIWLQEVN